MDTKAIEEALQPLLDSTLHENNCTAWGEGMACCFQKPEIILSALRALEKAGLIVIVIP